MTYKDFIKQYIGESDIAALTLVGYANNGVNTEMLRFGKDGSYHAYIVDKDGVEIGTHYEKRHTFSHWLKIYDDSGLVKTFTADTINIYRAGEMGCIVELIGCKEDNSDDEEEYKKIFNYDTYLGYVDFAKTTKNWERFMSEYGFPYDCPYDRDGLIQMCQIIFAVSRMDWKELVELSEMSGAEFAKNYNIPYRTLINWLSSGSQKRTAPEYVTELIGYAMIAEIPLNGYEE